MNPRKAKDNPEPCPLCLSFAKDGFLRLETVQPLPDTSAPPLDFDGDPCCHDCASAYTLIKLHVVHDDFLSARICVGNCRQEQLRLPGARLGLVAEGLMRPSLPGDLEKHHDWLRQLAKKEPWITEDGELLLGQRHRGD